MFVILKGKTRAPIGKFKAVHTQQKRIKIFVRTALPVGKPFDFIQHFGIIFFIYGKARIGEFFPFPRYDKRIVFTNRFSVFVQEIAVPIARFVMAVFKSPVIHCFLLIAEKNTIKNYCQCNACICGSVQNPPTALS